MGAGAAAACTCGSGGVFANGCASASRYKELHEAVSAQRNCLIEVILPTADGGAPRFCLAYVLPLQCTGPRASSVAVTFLDVHHSLPYMQRHMEARGFGDCDLYTFVKFSLLNCLVTDPSVRTADPAERNPIVFASAGFGVMCGCAPHDVMHRNCRFLQSPSFVASIKDTILQPEAVSHMSAALDARHESLTYLHNFRKDGTPFANLLFMCPIINRFNDGVLFWIGVQHPLGEQPSSSGVHTRAAAAGEAEADLHAQLRTCQQSLHAAQLQELYGSYTSMAQRTALLIQAADGSHTTMCRLCEQHVLIDSMQGHTQFCKVVTQCKTIAACSDTTLARQLVKLNAASSASAIFGASSTPAALVVDFLRSYTSVLLSITASTTTMPILDTLPIELDRLVSAAVQPTTAAIWADIRAAGQRKLAALQHACSWAGELQQTIVHMPTSDPLSQGQAPCLQDFEMVREIQRGSHATVWLVRKRQTNDVFAMKVIDRKSGRLNRLHTERKVLFLCSSPFVVKTFFAFEDSDSLYLVMERLHQDCKHVLQATGAMQESAARLVLADLVLALEHLHSCGIVHRDLKPENMLLTPSGRLKLADFGLSHIAQGRVGAARLDEVARDPSIVGTPFYMAPETIRGKSRGHESAADWWSFGVIMYEMILGFPPFQGAKVGEIYRAILSLAFTAPIANCAVSPESADLISRILVPDPRRRLCGSAAVMGHPWFGRVDWQAHASSAGLPPGQSFAHGQPPGASPQLHSSRPPSGVPVGHLSLAAHSAGGGGTLGGGPGGGGGGSSGGFGFGGGIGPAHATPPGMLFPPVSGAPLLRERTGSGGSKSSNIDGDAARSVQSMGMESAQSAASTNLNELGADGESSTHLDNLMGLNQKPLAAMAGWQPGSFH
jgi:serine/threonine protein kinase